MKNVGIVGIPPLAVIRELRGNGDIIHDLDEPLVKVDLETTTAFIPKVYCAILHTVVVNAMSLALDTIYIDVGPGKCDGALQVAAILDEILAIPVVRTKNEDSVRQGNSLCCSHLPLLEKLRRITANVISPEPTEPIPACKPTAGFWGVPPRDFSLLELFPETTHVYGWTRCMENKTPADHALERMFNPAIPTVFFAQSFCAKTALARMLAGKHPMGLYLDTDVQAGASAKAKVQAFLELSGACP